MCKVSPDRFQRLPFKPDGSGFDKIINVHAITFFITVLLFGASAQVEEYILQAGDLIAVNVVEHPEFSGRHKIRPDGRINYPVIGEVEVASLTCAQLVKIMQGKLAAYVNNPVVSVSIEAYYANKVFIIGDVYRSGEYEIYEPVDVIKALAMCGGLKNPKIREIKIIRADGSVTTLNMKDFWTTGAKGDKKKYTLYPGDTMYVPESYQIPWGFISTVLSVVNIALTVTIQVLTLSNK